MKLGEYSVERGCLGSIEQGMEGYLGFLKGNAIPVMLPLLAFRLIKGAGEGNGQCRASLP